MARTYVPCRKCGELLFRAEYVRFGRIESEADEQASGVSRHHHDGPVSGWMHRPCPACGEPRPMSRRWRGWAILIGFALLFAFGIWLELSGNADAG